MISHQPTGNAAADFEGGYKLESFRDVKTACHNWLMKRDEHYRQQHAFFKGRQKAQAKKKAERFENRRRAD